MALFFTNAGIKFILPMMKTMQVERAHVDGTVTFQDGGEVVADVILHCTGYKYHFPFLHSNSAVNVDDNRLGPLYKHVFPPALALGLSFVGLPWKVTWFILAELQSKWIAGMLSGCITLPSEEKMTNSCKFGLKQDSRNSNTMIGLLHRGSAPVEKWTGAMYYATGRRGETRPETYRDQWDDDDLIQQAHRDFIQYLPSGCGAIVATSSL